MPEQTEQSRAGLFNPDTSMDNSQTAESSTRSSGPLNVKPRRAPVTSKQIRRKDTIGFMLDEFLLPQPIPETFEAVDRSLPELPAPEIMVKAIATCQALFLDLDEMTRAISQSREHLFEALCGVANETQRQECAVSMAEFETRIIESFPERAEGEIHSAYMHLSRLLGQTPNDRSLPWQTRLLAVSHFLSHAAKPETVSQGSKIGAHVICLIQKMITTNPSRMADMLASASFDGSWQAFDGKEVMLDEHTMKPGPEEILYKPGDNRRSYATKILQCLLLNNCLLRRSVPLTYAENPGRPGKDYTGQLVRTLDGRAVSPKHGANLGFYELALLAQFEFGQKSCVIINDNSFKLESPEMLDLKKRKILVHVENYIDFSDLLQQAADDNNLPVMIAVDERRLLAEQYNDGINHIVSVVSYSESGAIKIYNPQLLPGTPRVARIALQKLYNATLSETRI